MPIRTEKGKDRYAEIQLAMWFENVRNAEIQLTKDTLQEIQRLKSSGMSPDNIAKSFMDRAKAGNGFEKSFLNDAAHELWKDMKAITQHEVYSSMDDGDYYKWEYNPSAKHCEVCMELNGKVKTFEEWEAEGLPGHRNEGCYANCCCDLVKVDNYSKTKAKAKTKAPSENKKEEKSEGSNNTVEDKTDYAKLLQDKFTSSFGTINISIENIGSLKKEYQKELYNLVNNIEKIYGKDILSSLDVIKATDFKKEFGEGWDTTLGVFRTIGKGEHEKNILAFNTKYFGEKVTSAALKTISHEINKFTTTAYHELGHYYYKKFENDTKFADMKKIVATFYKNNEKYILEEFGFIVQGGYKEDARPEEFCVDALARLRDGILTKLYGKDKKSDKVKETNAKVLRFIQKVDEIITNQQAGDKEKVATLLKELEEIEKGQQEKDKTDEKNSEDKTNEKNSEKTKKPKRKK
jgi:hypothetical protein